MARVARTLAIGFVSAGTLAYEILLVRAFAIEHFHHFASMAIGVAMLGFGVAGTFVALYRIRPPDSARWFAWSAVATAALLIVSPALGHLVRLDTTQLAWNTSQWVRLAVVEGCLALPFAAGGLTVLLALAAHRDEVGRLYGASFAGAGAGAAAALGCLWVLPPVRAIALPGVLAALGAVAATVAPHRAFRSRAAAVGVMLVTCLAVLTPPWQIDVSPYKGLAQVEAYPRARRVLERSHPAGWLVGIAAPAFRFAPGLSLGYSGDFPEQTGLFVDGQTAGALTDWSRAAGALDWLPTALPYAVTPPARVLVIGAAGGTEVANALSHGAVAVTAVELHPALVQLGRSLRLPGGASPDMVRWVSADARSFLARSGQRFDVISLAPAGGMGSSTAGLHSLAEDFLHTTEAYVAYLRHLTPTGVLAITRWLAIPPRESVRVLLTVAEALRQIQPDPDLDGLVVARGWGTVTVLAKPAGFTPTEVRVLREWTAQRYFDLDWYPGTAGASSEFNVLDDPVLFHAASAAVAGPDSLRRFADAYPFDVAPVTDARPYPHRFLRVGSLVRLLRSDRGDWIPFAEWGPVALLATLLQSALLAAVLMIVPAALAGPVRRGRGWLRLVGYFTAIGLAYLTAEIAAIQQFGLLLGHPVYAVAIVLTVFLIASGCGSAWSDRVAAARSPIITGVLATLLLGCAGALLSLVHALQPAPLLLRGAMAALVVVPVAFLMGTPFPIGLRRLAGDVRERVAWSWAANGFASVVAAPLAALVALDAGSPVLFLMAAAAYGAAAVLVK